MKVKVSITIEERVTAYESREVAVSKLEIEHIADDFRARNIMCSVTDALEDVTGRVEAQLRTVQKSRDALVAVEEEF